MKPPFLRTAYNYDTNEAGDASGLECKDKSMTQQHFKEECDINTIVERFHITGELPTNVAMPTSGDFTGIFDFQSAMNVIQEAKVAFQAMPADVRARFNNEPARFIAFCDDPENRAEALKLGLIDKKPPPAPKTAAERLVDLQLEEAEAKKQGAETPKPPSATK